MHNREAFAPAPRVAAIVAAGGSGQRMGGDPKQFRLLAGRPLLAWSVDALLAADEIVSIVLVAPAADLDRTRRLIPADPRIQVVAGGDSRSASVRAGLASLGATQPDLVLIHDAARPGLTTAVIGELVAALVAGADAAAPALPILDAIKAMDGETLRSVPRDGLFRVQTPQAFRFALIRDAHAANPESAVDDLALIEGAGARIELTPGRAGLMKITHAEDLAIVERLIAQPQAAPAIRIGSGFDVHAFAPGDGVTICGVRVPHTHALEGHSDADVGWHALTDAILGALALGDIGQHFPPSDPQWKGAASIRFLQHAQMLAADRGFKVVNADLTLVCERPKIGPHRDAMRAATAEALGLDMSVISVKATTTERLGFTGREEGIAAQAVVLLAG